MGQAVATLSTPALTVADLDTEVNCEPRILDTTLGAHLGMARPTNIRKQIEANRTELEGFGSLHAARAMIEAGKGAQREVVAFYLNEGQALCLCALSRAPNAPPVRRALIDAFMELRHRTLAAPVKVTQHRRRLPSPPRPAPDACLAMLPVIARAVEALARIEDEIRVIDTASVEAAGPPPIQPVCGPAHYPTFDLFDAAMDRWQVRLKEHDAAMMRHAARLGLPGAEDRRRLAKASLAGSLQRLADIPATTMEGLTEKARIALDHRSRVVRDSVTADLLAMQGPKAIAA